MAWIISLPGLPKLRKSVGGKKQATACTRLDSRSTGSLAFGSPLSPAGPQHQRQVPARRAAVDPDPIRVDAVVLGMMANEPDGPVHVLDDLGDGEPGLAAVDHGEDGVAAVDERSDEGRVDRLVRGEEAAADDEDDADALGVLLGREDVHRQGGAVLPPVDHVFLAVEGRLAAEAMGCRGRDTQSG